MVDAHTLGRSLTCWERVGAVVWVVWPRCVPSWYSCTRDVAWSDGSALCLFVDWGLYAASSLVSLLATHSFYPLFSSNFPARYTLTPHELSFRTSHPNHCSKRAAIQSPFHTGQPPDCNNQCRRSRVSDLASLESYTLLSHRRSHLGRLVVIMTTDVVLTVQNQPTLYDRLYQ